MGQRRCLGYPPAKVKLPPYIVDKRVREDFSKYLAEITYFDSQVGEILALIEKHQLADNTLVMVVSEQGSAFPFAVDLLRSRIAIGDDRALARQGEGRQFDRRVVEYG